MELDKLEIVLREVLGLRPLSYMFDTKEYPVSFFKYKQGMFFIKTNLKDRPQKRILAFHHQGRQYRVSCKLIAADGGIESLQPIDLAMTDSPREFERFVVSSEFKVSGITSLQEIGEVVKLNHRAITSLKEALEQQLSGKFAAVNIHIYSGGIINRRLEFLSALPRVIFYNKGQPPKSSDYFPHDDFENKIFGHDRNIMPDIQSEITVPIVYKGKLPFGYVQVNSLKPLSEGVVRAIKKLAINLEYKIRKLPAAWEVNIDGNIIDLSAVGLSFDFAVRDHAKHFHPQKSVFLNMTMPGEKPIQALAEVKHQDFVSGKNWVGLAFHNMDALSEIALEDVLDKLKNGFKPIAI